MRCFQGETKIADVGSVVRRRNFEPIDQPTNAARYYPMFTKRFRDIADWPQDRRAKRQDDVVVDQVGRISCGPKERIPVIGIGCTGSQSSRPNGKFANAGRF